MIYEYRCVQCGIITESRFYVPIGQTLDLACPHCGGRRRRMVSTPAFVRTELDTHFNTTLGKVVHNNSEFRSELARKNDEMSERTGFESNYQPIDLRDKDACKVTDEGMDETHRRKRDTGEDQPRRRIIV